MARGSLVEGTRDLDEISPDGVDDFGMPPSRIVGKRLWLMVKFMDQNAVVEMMPTVLARCETLVESIVNSYGFWCWW